MGRGRSLALVQASAPRLEHFSFRLNLSAVIAGLDPAIHLLTKMDGCAGAADKFTQSAQA
jgi:hypothetical protein